MQLNMGLII